MEYLVKTTEMYRVASREEANELIAKAAKSCSLQRTNVDYKNKKEKGEIIDEWYAVTLVKVFNDEKDPEYQYDVSYSMKGGL